MKRQPSVESRGGSLTRFAAFSLASSFFAALLLILRVLQEKILKIDGMTNECGFLRIVQLQLVRKRELKLSLV